MSRNPARHSTRRRLVAGLTVVAATVALATALGSSGPAAAETGPLPNIENFENTSVSTTFPGVFPFGDSGTPSDTPALSIVDGSHDGSPAGNHVLDVPYDITGNGGYGGFSDDLATAQDWSAYGGFSFWVKGTDSGKQIEYEIKDGGTNAEAAELWQGFFTDDSSDWKQVQLPFADFVKRADYQPPGAPTDGTLGLTSMWGFAVNLPANNDSDLQFDDFALYGTAQPRVSASPSTVFVDQGDTAHVPVVVTTADGQPTTAAITVDYTLGGGTGVEGTNYEGGSGELTFPVGTASGATQTVDVTTDAVTGPDQSRTVPVALTVDGADLTGPQPTVVVNAHGYPYLNPNLPVAQRVADLMSHMTLADKVGQMTQAERAAVGDGTDITKYELGSLLSGGGSVPASNTPQGWADMIDGYQDQALSTPLQIPMIYGIDSVHGDNNLAGATIFPHNEGMGATRDPALVQREEHVVATETRATGIPWVFAPCICVTRDERWGRSYESYGEDTALVTDMTTPAIDGLQGTGKDHLARDTSVLATAKHFLGDGGTKYGSSTTSNYTIDQGITYVTRKQLNQLYVPPYRVAAKDGVGAVMPSYSSLQILGRDKAPIKMSARKDMITGLLKKKLGFKGFVISDYAAIDQISPNYKKDVRISVNAGMDMVMVPNDYQTFEADLTALAGHGVPMSRIDDAVRRILTQKFKLGLFDHPFADTANAGTIGDAAHRAVARRAAAESQVLLKNSGNILPLAPKGKIYVAGSNANDEGNQTGGWTLTWQGQSGDIPGATSILQGMREDAPNAKITYSEDASAPTAGYKVGVVVVGETPYAEGMGDVGVNGHTLELSVADRNAVDTVCGAMPCVVLDVSGRPQDLTGIVPEAKAVVASWLPGSEGEGVADTLFGARPFTGRLPVTWAKAESQIPINVGDKTYDPLYPYGWGLRTDSTHARLTRVKRELASMSGATGPLKQVTAALIGSNWKGQVVTHPGVVLDALADAAGQMQSSKYGFALQNLLVSVARDLAQRAIIADRAMSATAAMTADAEHDLMAGNPGAAVRLLAKARATAVTVAARRAARLAGH